MLTSTFCHIPGVGEITEKHLWSLGCDSWHKILENDYSLPKEKHVRAKAGALESIQRLKDMDHRYFAQRLPHGTEWRAYRAFKDHACFIDIETTGLSAVYHQVTTVCVHSKHRTKNYIVGQNMHELLEDIEEYKYIVSFNGARFDLPFLEKRLGMEFHQIHLDLIYPAKTLGLRGGLKSIEKQLGIGRETEGVTGYDAVRLWHSYQQNREIEVAGQRVRGEKSLELLVKYNEEDTVNLEKMTDILLKELMEKAKNSAADR
jgi:hypothetical protein